LTLRRGNVTVKVHSLINRAKGCDDRQFIHLHYLNAQKEPMAQAWFNLQPVKTAAVT
jgi:hypothetical protein